MKWRFWRKPVVVDLGTEGALMVDHVLATDTPELHGHFTVGRAAEKAAKRQRQGKPPHRLRSVSLEALRANPRASYRGVPTPPAWLKDAP